MSKVHAHVGLVASVETSPGVYQNEAVEIEIVGDSIQDRQRWMGVDNVLSNVKLEHRISFIAEATVLEQLNDIRYVKLFGVKWGVSTIRDEPPRLVLVLGGVYNG